MTKHLVILLGATLALAGCEGSGYSGAKHSDNLAKAQAAQGEVAPTYAEVEKDGKYYVFGSAKKAEAFKQTGKKAGMEAHFNAGPKGETVYVETSKGGYQEKLLAQFKQKHGIK
jgi:uncharacterized ParB-like nuclease family protein